MQDHFHVKIDSNFTSIPARVLPKPRVAYGNKRFATVSPSAAWSLRGLPMSRPATIPPGNWTWLYLTMIGSPGAFQNIGHLQSSLESFQTSLRKQGIKIGHASQGSRRLHLNNEEDPTLETTLKTAAEKGLDMMLIIMPAKNTALFSKHKLSRPMFPNLLHFGLSDTYCSRLYNGLLTYTRPDKISLRRQIRNHQHLLYRKESRGIQWSPAVFWERRAEAQPQGSGRQPACESIKSPLRFSRGYDDNGS